MKRRDFIKKSLLGLMAAPFAQAAAPSVAEAEQVSESVPIDSVWMTAESHRPITWEWAPADELDGHGEVTQYYDTSFATAEMGTAETLSDIVSTLKKYGVISE